MISFELTKAISREHVVSLIVIFILLFGSAGFSWAAWTIAIAGIIAPLLLLMLFLGIELANHYMGLSVELSVAFILLIFYLWLKSKIEYPITAELNNEEYIRYVELQNNALTTLKGMEGRNEAMTHWIGDGIPLEVPNKISVFRQSVNRLKYDAIIVKNYIADLISYIRWEFGSGGTSGYYKKHCGKNLHISKDMSDDDVCRIVEKFIDEVETVRGFKFTYLLFMVSYIALWVVIFDFLHINFYIHCMTAIACLFVLVALYRRFLRRYAFSANSNYNNFLIIVNEIHRRKLLLGVGWSSKSERLLSNSNRKIVVGLFSKDESEVEEGFLLFDHDQGYIILMEDMGFEAFHTLYSVIKSVEKFDGWVKFFAPNRLN